MKAKSFWQKSLAVLAGHDLIVFETAPDKISEKPSDIICSLMDEVTPDSVQELLALIIQYVGAVSPGIENRLYVLVEEMWNINPVLEPTPVDTVFTVLQQLNIGQEVHVEEVVEAIKLDFDTFAALEKETQRMIVSVICKMADRVSDWDVLIPSSFNEDQQTWGEAKFDEAARDRFIAVVNGFAIYVETLGHQTDGGLAHYEKWLAIFINNIKSNKILANEDLETFMTILLNQDYKSNGFLTEEMICSLLIKFFYEFVCNFEVPKNLSDLADI